MSAHLCKQKRHRLCLVPCAFICGLFLLVQEPAARAITQEALSGAEAALDAIARQLPALVQHLLIKQRHGEPCLP